MKEQKVTKAIFEVLNPKTLYDPIPYGYSHVANVLIGCQLVFVSGQGGEDDKGSIVPDFKAQVKQAFDNMEKALVEVGLNMSNVVKLTTLIVDYDSTKHKVLNEVSQKIWTDQRYPAQTLIPVPKLALEQMLFEVEAIAVKS